MFTEFPRRKIRRRERLAEQSLRRLTTVDVPSPRAVTGSEPLLDVNLSRAARLNSCLSSVTVLLVAGDLLSVAAVTLSLRIGPRTTIGLGVVILVLHTAFRLYRARLRLSYFDDVPRAMVAACVAFVVAVSTVVLGDVGVPVRDLILALAMIVLASEVQRAVVLQFARWVRRRLRTGDRTLVIGADQVGLDLTRTMVRHPEFGLRPVAVLDPSRERWEQVDGVVGLPAATLEDAVTRFRVETVVLAFAGAESEVVDTAIAAHAQGCAVLVVPRLFELHHDASDVERLRSYPLVRLTIDPTRRPSWKMKRLLDVVLAGLALMALTPFMALLAAAVLLESGRPIIFRQRRVGRGDREFDILKFRSVRGSGNDPDDDTCWSVRDDSRVGPVGRLLRRSSMDELPQLWNIVRGDMSLVGPRPERPLFVDRFSTDDRWYAARHRVPAGLTGLAQVNGLRGDTSITERVRYDNYYIATWSIWLDLRIMVVTASELLRRGTF